MPRVLTGPEVEQHASRESCWIIVHGKRPTPPILLWYLILIAGKVYDVTDFLDGNTSFHVTLQF